MLLGLMNSVNIQSHHGSSSLPGHCNSFQFDCYTQTKTRRIGVLLLMGGGQFNEKLHSQLTKRVEIFIKRVALAKQGDNAVGSVHPSVRPCVCLCSHA